MTLQIFIFHVIFPWNKLHKNKPTGVWGPDMLAQYFLKMKNKGRAVAEPNKSLYREKKNMTKNTEKRENKH